MRNMMCTNMKVHEVNIRINHTPIEINGLLEYNYPYMKKNLNKFI